MFLDTKPFKTTVITVFLRVCCFWGLSRRPPQETLFPRRLSRVPETLSTLLQGLLSGLLGLSPKSQEGNSWNAEGLGIGLEQPGTWERRLDVFEVFEVFKVFELFLNGFGT